MDGRVGGWVSGWVGRWVVGCVGWLVTVQRRFERSSLTGVKPRGCVLSKGLRYASWT